MKQLIKEQLSQFEKQEENYMTDLHAYYHSQWNGTNEEKEVYRIEAEKLGWKEIEEEFRKEYVVKSNAGTGLLRYTDADKIIAFFKPYFQEKMHELSVSELEIVDNNPKE